MHLHGAWGARMQAVQSPHPTAQVQGPSMYPTFSGHNDLVLVDALSKWRGNIRRGERAARCRRSVRALHTHHHRRHCHNTAQATHHARAHARRRGHLHPATRPRGERHQARDGNGGRVRDGGSWNTRERDDTPARTRTRTPTCVHAITLAREDVSAHPHPTVHTHM